MISCANKILSRSNNILSRRNKLKNKTRMSLPGFRNQNQICLLFIRQSFTRTFDHGSKLEGYLGYFKMFLFLNENLCCDPSLEPSRRDEAVQMMGHKILFFMEKNG